MDAAPLARLHAAHPDARRWVVAYSGGMDSHVLLDLCQRYAASVALAPPLVALYVDHGIHPDSPGWGAHCAQVCAAAGVRFEQRVAEAGEQRSEDALRRARYRVFEAFCEPADLLLLAHHQDDQAETLLLRLMRGTGPAGLGGMPAERPCGAALLCRPLLGHTRAGLSEHAAQAGLKWIEDPANAAPRYGRNHLRHRVMPLIEQRWPGASARMARTAEHCAEAARICAQRAVDDFSACLGLDRYGQRFLSLEPWRALGADRGRNLLREWLKDGGAGPVEARLVDTLRQEVIDAREDRQPRLVVGAVEVRRFAGALYLLPVSVAGRTSPEGFEIGPGLAREIAGVGRIALLPERGGGVRLGGRYRVAFRRPGLRCRLAGRPERALKLVLQEAGVPPWLRDRVPLLYVDGELAAVADLGVCEGFVAQAGADAVSFSWSASVAG